MSLSDLLTQPEDNNTPLKPIRVPTWDELAKEKAAKKRKVAEAKKQAEAKKKADAKAVATTKSPATAAIKELQGRSRDSRRQAGDKRTLAQVRQQTPGTWENEVVRARKELGIKQGSAEDQLLKSALWTVRYYEPDAKAPTIDKARAAEFKQKMKTAEGRAELTARVEEYRKRHQIKAQLPELSPATDDQIRKGQITGTPRAMMEWADQVEADLARAIEKVIPHRGTSEFISAVLMDIPRIPERFGYAVQAGQQIAAGNQDFGVLDILGPAAQIGLSAGGAAGTIKGIAKIGNAVRFGVRSGNKAAAARALESAGVAADDAAKVVDELAANPKLLDDLDEVARGYTFQSPNTLEGLDYDAAGGKHTDGIRALVDADAVRGATEHRGRSQLIGSWDDREEGRKIYEQILKDNPRRVGGTDEAQGHLPGAETTGRRGLDEPPAFDAGDGQALRGSAGTTESAGPRNPAQPPAPVQAGVTEPDPAIVNQVAAKAKARKVARQAARDRGETPLASGFDPEILYDAIDDAIIWMAERAYPVEVAIREAIKAYKLPEDAGAQIRQAIDDEMAGRPIRIEPSAARTTDHAPPVARSVDNPQAQRVPNATGLANRVQEEEALSGIIQQVAPAKGAGARHWQKAGRSAVEGGADYERLAYDIASGKAPMNAENVGILLEGKRRLLSSVNRLREAMKNDPALVTEYREAQLALDNYLEAVQAGKGQWSDVGRALQAGAKLDTADFAAVMGEARQFGKVTAKAERELKAQTEKIASLNRRIETLESQATKSAEAIVTRATKSRGPRIKRDLIRGEINDALQRLKALRAAPRKGVKPGRTRGSVSPITADDIRFSAEQAKIIKDIALGYVKLGANTVEEVIAGVKQAVKSQLGMEIEEDAIRVALGHGERNALDALDSAIAERDRLDRAIKAQLADIARSPVEKTLTGLLNATRGAQLGADMGVLIRQGLFGVFTRPRSWGRGVRNLGRSLFSEAGLARVEREIATKVIDGKRVAPLRKQAGLSLTIDNVHPEETLAFSRLLKKIPLLGEAIGGSLERAQSAFLNTLRADLFDQGVRKGWTLEELTHRARFINDATGRGNINNVPRALQAVMTSPRYEASRWAMIGRYFASPTEAARMINNRAARENIKDLAGTAASIVALGKAAELAGYEFVWQDPTSTDFLKLRKGDQVYDFTAGIAPRLRDTIRLGVTLLNPDSRMNYGDLIKAGGMRALNPGITTPTELGSREFQKRILGRQNPKGLFGYESDEHEIKGLLRLAPLIMQSFIENLGLMKEGKATMGETAGAAAIEFTGGSASRYPKSKRPSGLEVLSREIDRGRERTPIKR